MTSTLTTLIDQIFNGSIVVDGTVESDGTGWHAVVTDPYGAYHKAHIWAEPSGRVTKWEIRPAFTPLPPAAELRVKYPSTAYANLIQRLSLLAQRPLHTWVHRFEQAIVNLVAEKLVSTTLTAAEARSTCLGLYRELTGSLSDPTGHALYDFELAFNEAWRRVEVLADLSAS